MQWVYPFSKFFSPPKWSITPFSWNTDVLLNLLKQVVLQRENTKKGKLNNPVIEGVKSKDAIVIDEVQEIIELPQRDLMASKSTNDISSVDLGDEVPKQLRNYVSISKCCQTSILPVQPCTNLTLCYHLRFSISASRLIVQGQPVS